MFQHHFIVVYISETIKSPLREAYILFNIYISFDKKEVKKITLAYSNNDIKQFLKLSKVNNIQKKKQILLSEEQLKKRHVI